MSKVYEAITDGVRAWVDAQPMFFVSTAPLAADGHVNSSPRGHDALRILGPHRLAWMDLTGSGAETIAHLKENGRICVMLCAFEGAPRIMRFHGRGQVHALGSPEFTALAPAFPDLPGARAIIEVEVQRIADSCGYAVPRMEVIEQRDVLVNWAEKRGVDGLEAYRQECNASSLDGLPAWDGAIANDD